MNPYRSTLATHNGSRVLVNSLGILNVEVADPWNKERLWTVQRVYSPIKRALGGVRIKLEDQKGFITFCNQRDFEVLLDIGEPGKWCIWADQEYVAPQDNGWFGLCADDLDLLDDLYDRECEIRQQFPNGLLPSGLELTRWVHFSRGLDAEVLNMMLFDADPETGMGPDPRFQTIARRWTEVGKDKLIWQHLPLY